MSTFISHVKLRLSQNLWCQTFSVSLSFSLSGPYCFCCFIKGTTSEILSYFASIILIDFKICFQKNRSTIHEMQNLFKLLQAVHVNSIRTNIFLEYITFTHFSSAELYNKCNTVASVIQDGGRPQPRNPAAVSTMSETSPPAGKFIDA